MADDDAVNIKRYNMFVVVNINFMFTVPSKPCRSKGYRKNSNELLNSIPAT